MGKLFDEIDNICGKGDIPFHMPGHKRNALNSDDAHSGGRAFFTEWYKRDLTEIPESDDLHAPSGILKSAMDRAASVFGSDRAFFLVNGSTCGVLAMLSLFEAGDKILMMRGSHLSAYNALRLKGLVPVFICGDTDPESGAECGVGADIVRAALEKEKDIKAVFITSPTYEGSSSDLQGIAEAAHDRNIPLLVDAAHGAHFGFSKEFPESAMRSGADVCVISLHKTLPAPTQTALLLTSGNRFERDKLEYYLSVYQTSSPSYLLMAGIDDCVHLTSSYTERDWSNFARRVKHLHDACSGLKNIKTVSAFSESRLCVEPGKLLLIPSEKGRGCALGRYLSALHIIPEMALPSYVLMIITICDTDETMKALEEAIISADEHVMDWPEAECRTDDIIPEDIASYEGKISGSTVSVYPPGRPLFIPGEIMDKVRLDKLRKAVYEGLEIRGRLTAIVE